MSNDHEKRLKRLDERLTIIEKRLGFHQPPPVRETPSPTPLPSAGRARPIPPTPTPAAVRTESGFDVSATTILGWGGIAALVLAAAYLIRLAIDSGFLTPMRQVGLAGLFGVGLIVSGLLFRDSWRRYGSLLPAGGIAVLFLTVYGAHLYHGLIGATSAAVGVIVVCLVSLRLSNFYKNELYTFFAVVGSYTGPLFLHILAARPVDLVIYFGAWDLLFCAYAVRVRWRMVYLLSAYLAFIGFDASWRMIEQTDWVWAAGFQATQFLIFLGATAWYSIQHKCPLREREALLHLAPLLFFYATEYGLLARHIPATAPWLAMASVIPMAAAYMLVSVRLPQNTRAGELIISAYTAIVLFHAGYMELIPSGWRELTGLLTLIALGILGVHHNSLLRRHWPIALAMGAAAFVGYVRLTSGIQLNDVVAWRALVPLYAVALYVAYWSVRIPKQESVVANATLYLAHLNVLAGAVHLSDSRLVVSLVWGVLAVAALAVSMMTQDRRLGRSGLLVFAAFAAKVLLFDLSGASPLVRIGCLAVLGVTMYVGGILYQKIDALGPKSVRRANERPPD